jgi:hypothetical protein
MSRLLGPAAVVDPAVISLAGGGPVLYLAADLGFVDILQDDFQVSFQCETVPYIAHGVDVFR